jgi:thiol-disulfide isomerase/thioredoxin
LFVEETSMRTILVTLLLLLGIGFAFAQEPSANEAAQALVGKSAADFKLDLLGGGQAKLADHKGKDVVIIDFWATWCPPCVAELPEIAEVAKARADKGVVFYAINEEEDVADVKRFLDEKKLTGLKVALDKDGEVAKAYMVDPLPQSVIIGRDGLVKTVLIGIKSKDDFAKAVDAALEQK